MLKLMGIKENIYNFTLKILVYINLWLRDFSKCSRISNIFLFLFRAKMLVIRDENHKMLDRIANREDPD